ncbi:MAG: glycosyltransferase, partial [Crocinitomicaceae bacterium]|nr:glycosyltransferase [Crocinitomicaceae bacterium]
LPYSNFHTEARKRLKEEDIVAVIASGRPFQSFAIGHKLKKEFDVLWIPDYRDEWNTHQNIGDQNFIERKIQRLMRKSELKWTSNADFFLTVSDTWVDSISAFIKKDGKAVYNGYVELKEPKSSAEPSKKLIITYAGTLYPTQNLSLFLGACISILSKKELDFEVRFIGANVIPEEELKIRQRIKGHESNFVFYDRMPKEELHQFMTETDVLYLTGFENIKGWYPVKLFEYYAEGKPLLLCPSDNDVMESFIRKTNIGHIANSEKECEEIILSLINQKMTGQKLKYERNTEYGQTFNREYQTSNLAKLIHEKL